jgi:uncharacterized protein (DUF1800 family)
VSSAAVQASLRFGLGPRGGELAEIGADARGWVLAQVRSPRLPNALRAREDGEALITEALQAIRKGRSGQAERSVRALRAVYIEETGARFAEQVTSRQPVVERMTLFWSNHFPVSVRKPIVAGLANAYEVEAIRPHLAGHFEDMLLAVVRHPAMLFYLDNIQSFGPNSPAGRRRGKGLNENLAREILELHTLGVDGGYTQQDVVALAKILTGWTLEYRLGRVYPRYRFQARVHEPGGKTLLGRRFAEAGEEEGIEALRMLAQHPATARHIATKLARHYIADAPPAASVERLTAVFLDSGGHLPSVMEAVLREEAAWAPFAKLKNPYEFALSAVRLTDVVPTAEQVVGGLEALNYRAFNAPSPQGWPDVAEAWAAPDALMKRIEWGHRLARHVPARTDPLRLAAQALGPILGATTRQTIERAASVQDGVALLLASPEFQRR